MSNSIKPSPSRFAQLEGWARVLRHHLTPSEQVLWQALRGQRLGVVFRRQVRLGSYIVDFLAPSVRLVVEVDGGYHQARRNSSNDVGTWGPTSVQSEEGARVRWLHSAEPSHDCGIKMLGVAALVEPGE